MTSHEIDYKILGNDIQMVEVELDPQETVIAEAGTMIQALAPYGRNAGKESQSILGQFLER